MAGRRSSREEPWLVTLCSLSRVARDDGVERVCCVETFRPNFASPICPLFAEQSIFGVECRLREEVVGLPVSLLTGGTLLLFRSIQVVLSVSYFCSRKYVGIKWKLNYYYVGT